MAKNDFENGVWRTVGGRRIFIRDGEDLSSAMKRSGKFKNKRYAKDVKSKTMDQYIEDHNKKVEEGSSKEKSMDEAVKDLHNELENTDGRKVFKLQEQRLDELAEKHGFDRDKMAEKLKDLRQKDLDDYEAKRKESGEPSSFEKREAQMYSNGKDSKSLSELRDEYIKSDEFSPNKPMKEWMKEKGYNKESSKEKNSLVDEYNKRTERGSMDDDSFTEKARKQGMSDEDIAKEVYKKHNGPEANNSTDDNIKRLLAKQKREEATASGDERTAKTFEKYEKEYERRISEKQQGVQNLKDKLSSNKEQDEAATVRSQMSELEQASGSKVKNAFQTDLFGNGKENRFILEDGTIVGHTLESFGQKRDDWYVGNKNFKSYDDVKKYLSGGSDNSKQSGYTEKQLRDAWKKEDATEIYNHLSRSELNKLHQATRDMETTTPGTPGHENAKQYVEKMEKKAATKFLDSQSKSNNNTAYKNAFNEYKKKHPNSKITLQKFIDMSEGK